MEVRHSRVRARTRLVDINPTMMPNLMAAPEGETERRRAIARHLVDRLADETDLRASLLAGSAAQGTSDQHSDIDLLNYYDVLPEPAAFDSVLSGMGG